MPRPSFAQFVEMIETDPVGREALRLATGLTPHQAAAMIFGRVSDADRAGRRDEANRILSEGARIFGIETSGIDGWTKGSDAMLEAAGDDRDSIHRAAVRLSEQSKRGIYSPPERIERMLHSARRSSLQQGLADRMRESDRHRAQQDPRAEPDPKLREHSEDRADLRAALNASIASTPGDDYPRLKEAPSLRDALAQAYDAHAELADRLDPLEDERLLALSDAV